MTAEIEPWFAGFQGNRFPVNGIRIFARVGGLLGGPPLLLLHGFPQTHAMWHRVAKELAPHFALVIPDLRGYGDSDKPADLPRHVQQSKRSMAHDMAELMRLLGHDRFAVAGHDRGGRVAHRLALDHAQRVSRLCLIDIAPTLDMYDATNMYFARAYYHWFHLIQPAPLPERMIGACASFYLHTKLGGWGGKGGLLHVEDRALAEYERCFCHAAAIHSACEDYRASADIDLEHDRISREQGQRITCDTLVIWAKDGVVNRLFDPLALWQAQCSAQVSGEAWQGGHFVPEEYPQRLASRFREFFAE